MAYQCTECSKNFSSRGNLTEHQYTHSKERVMCEMPNCERTYSNVSNCRRHFRDYHKPLIRAEQERLCMEEERRRADREHIVPEVAPREALERAIKNFYIKIEKLQK